MPHRAHSIFPLLFLFLIFQSAAPAGAQEFFRFRADFSIKEKESGQEQGRLVTGTVYYDKNLRKIDYEIRFPEPERWLIRDTLMVRLRGDSVAERRTIAAIGENSLFHLILHQQLSDFGLKAVGYVPGEVRAENGQVISRWEPPASLAASLGAVVLAQEKKLLTAIAILDKSGKTLAKFYLRDYAQHDGLPVPGKIYQTFYQPDGRELIRVLAFSNIVLNETDRQDFYDFRLPDGQ